jgi:uncharacterized protein
VKEIMVASHDRQCFASVLQELHQQGVRTTVLGFSERVPWAVCNAEIEFIDLESIPGMFPERLPREKISLKNLPRAGAFYMPVLSKRSGSHEERTCPPKSSERRGLFARLLGKHKAA